jgi:primosomal protein N' (replication factor Y) (superfamily II helicase)
VAFVAECFAEVAVFSALDKSLCYSVPQELQNRVCEGVRALVPLGRREVSGLIVGLLPAPPDMAAAVAVKPLLGVLDSQPVAPHELIELCRWISKYYFYPFGEVLQTALPSAIQATPRAFYRLTELGREAIKNGHESELLGLFSHASQLLEADVLGRAHSPKKIKHGLKDLEKQALIERFFRWQTVRAHPKTIKMVRLVGLPSPEELGKNDNLRRLTEDLVRAEGLLPMRCLRHNIKNADYWIRKLQHDGILCLEDVEEVRESHHAQLLPTLPPPVLTAEQAEAMDAVVPCILEPRFKPFVLFGVTGSGKTEIYLRLIEKVIEENRSGLVLVPEIALSTQMEAVFRQRFGSMLAIWHSGLPMGARYDQWREVLTGRRKIVLGVRSAVFMPLNDLGLIIVDEEHDSSYKQDDHLRYNARDVALVRAQMLKIPIVLGSATPSLQSVHHCRLNRYQMLDLPSRVFDRPMPGLKVVDMRRESSRSRIISLASQEALVETFKNGQQALVFLNRRGFAVFFLCRSCGHVPHCTHCSVSLTYHQKDQRLRCHYCGWERPVPEVCPACDHASLFPHGFGTERVEEEVKRLLPEARIVRIDRDTVSHSSRMVESLNAVRHDRADILIGTQMIAKGHDFPNITLVVVVNADTSLQVPDLRAGETTVQLLMQVAGRAGRGDKPGRVILQTYNPAHYTIESVLKMEYLPFCERELESREKLQYPPFTKLLRLLVTASDERKTEDAARQLAVLCRRLAEQFRVEGQHLAILGPSAAPLARLNNRFRWHVFVKAWTNQDLQQYTAAVLSESKNSAALRRVQLTVDRDPLTSL